MANAGLDLKMDDEFIINLDDHEIERRALMNYSIGGDDLWAAEEAAVARKLLYNNLDDEQQKTLDTLTDQGVIPNEIDDR
jgi:hypothetical protein